jgi:hypothetical protein
MTKQIIETSRNDEVKKYLGIWDTKIHGEFDKDKITELLLQQNLKVIRIFNYSNKYFINMEKSE